MGNKYLLQKIEKIFRPKKLSIEDIHALAAKGNKKAIKFWNDTAIHIGNALSGVINILNPSMIIIGGGVSNNFRFFSKKVKETIKDRAMRVPASMVRIVRARLGDDAGIIGAYVLVMNNIKHG